MHVILVHGWEGWPENAWFPWLRRELEKRGYTTEALKLPNPALPDRKTWVRMVKESIKSPDTILVGHSMGCPTILLALQEYDGPPVAQVVCVSGFGRVFNIPGLELWFGDAKIDFLHLKQKARRWSVIHGKNDYLVPFAEGEWLAQQLGVPLISTKRNGHLIHVEMAFELPEALDAIL